MTRPVDPWLAKLARLAFDDLRPRIPLGDLLAAMDHSGTNAAILCLALPNILPLPPGVSTVLGLPLLMLNAQLLVGRPTSIPGWLARLSAPRAGLGMALARMARLLSWRCQADLPRWHVFVGAPARRLAGGLGCVLAVLLLLPVPLVGVPIGLALSLLSLGILRGDGLLALWGFCAGALSLVLTAALGWGLWALR